MRNAFIDSDVILDYLSNRLPFAREASLLFTLMDQKTILGHTSSLCLTNIYYILRKHFSHEQVIIRLETLCQVIDILKVDSKVISEALASRFKDFEDAIQYYSAKEQGTIDVLVTRNIKDYKESQIPVMTPDSYLKLIQG